VFGIYSGELMQVNFQFCLWRRILVCMWDLLLDNIKRRDVELTPAEIEIVQSLFSYRKFRKHQYILQEGEVSTHDNFVIKGICRTYRVDEDGHEHILRFTPEEWWVGDLASFLSEKPSLYNVDCLEDTEILRITYQDLETLFEKVPKMNKYFRLLYQKSIISYNVRLTSNQTKSASERYEEFIRTFPLIGQRVSDQQIASYLGITPQSLSRIRNQSQKKGS
jgi:CRP-like cAMP-binding protein